MLPSVSMTCRQLPLPRAHPSSVTSPAPRIACPGCRRLCSAEAGSEGATWTSPFFSASRGKIPTPLAGSALPRKELFKRLISPTVTIFRGWAGRWRPAQCPAKEQTQVKTPLPNRPGDGGAAQALDAQPRLQPTPTYQLPFCTHTGAAPVTSPCAHIPVCTAPRPDPHPCPVLHTPWLPGSALVVPRCTSPQPPPPPGSLLGGSLIRSWPFTCQPSSSPAGTTCLPPLPSRAGDHLSLTRSLGPPHIQGLSSC